MDGKAMTASRRVIITGIGLGSPLGWTSQNHLDGFADVSPPSPAFVEAWRPCCMLDAGAFDPADHVPARSDRRQMEQWQLLGVSAAAQALVSARCPEGVARQDVALNIAANGGAREHVVDIALLSELRNAPDRDLRLNMELGRKLRPSFLLGQLANMLAGNIAILLGTGGGARTFLGEEIAGVQALRDAVARIAAGQDECILLVAVFDAQQAHTVLSLELGGLLQREPAPPVLSGARSGLVPGTQAVALVLEAEEAARRRGAPLRAVVGAVAEAWAPAWSLAGSLADRLAGLTEGHGVDLCLTGASGLPGVTAIEIEAIHRLLPDVSVQAVGDRIGHGMEATFPALVALAAQRVEAGPARSVLASVVGHRHGAGAALVEAVS
jgi:3-oxoacyl-[acyl-carrier-protein] synthase II